jgi:hypothetical protein
MRKDPCGCEIYDGQTPAIEPCPLHRSAHDLLEALKNMLWHEDKYAARKQAAIAVAKAEGRS